MMVLTPFMAATAFMTRLAPARIHSDEDMAAAVKYFPLVGVVLGGLVTLPFHLGLFATSPWIQAWMLAGFSLWATRGLHWDGWADIFDAWGSGERGERFWEILKDSRIGAFGVMALVMGLGGQILLLHEALAVKAYGAVAFSFVLGRALCVGLAYTGRKLARGGGLGRLTLAGATPWALLVALGLVLVTAPAMRPVIGLAPGLMIGLLGLTELNALARRAGGLNGDFLGAMIVWGELSALMGWLLTAHVNLVPLF